MQGRETERENIDFFPDEILLYIISFLSSYKDIGTLSRVSSRWSTLSRDEAKRRLQAEFHCDAPLNEPIVQYYVALNYEKDLLEKYLRVIHTFEDLMRRISFGDENSNVSLKKVYDDEENLKALVLTSRKAFLDEIENKYNEIKSDEQLKKAFDDKQQLKKTTQNPAFLYQYEKDFLLATCICDTHRLLNVFLNNNIKFLDFLKLKENDKFVFNFIIAASSRLHFNSINVLIKTLNLNQFLTSDTPENILWETLKSVIKIVKVGEKANQLKQLVAAQKIIELLLEHGANPDQPVEFEKGDQIERFGAVKNIFNLFLPQNMKLTSSITIRKVCSRYLAELEDPKNLPPVNPEVRLKLKEILNLIKSHYVVDEKKSADEDTFDAHRCRPM